MAVDIAVAIFSLLGSLFALMASIGILRMPDLYMRMQAATKAGTMGAGCLLLALAIHSADTGVTFRALLVIVFLFMTAPVAAHVIARAAYIVGVPLWKTTFLDELCGHYGTGKQNPTPTPSTEKLTDRECE